MQCRACQPKPTANPHAVKYLRSALFCEQPVQQGLVACNLIRMRL